jgi:2-isopropylmalate synthase
MAMRVRQDVLPYATAVRSEGIFEASRLLAELTGQGVQPNKAIVGRNAFAHEAGIHQDGVLKDRRTYEIMRPQDVGVPATTLVLGKHSGRHAVKQRCEQLGYSLDRLQIDRVYRAMVVLADAQKTIDDGDLENLIHAVTRATAEDREQARAQLPPVPIAVLRRTKVAASAARRP